MHRSAIFSVASMAACITGLLFFKSTPGLACTQGGSHDESRYQDKRKNLSFLPVELMFFRDIR